MIRCDMAFSYCISFAGAILTIWCLISPLACGLSAYWNLSNIPFHSWSNIWWHLPCTKSTGSSIWMPKPLWEIVDLGCVCKPAKVLLCFVGLNSNGSTGCWAISLLKGRNITESGLWTCLYRIGICTGQQNVLCCYNKLHSFGKALDFGAWLWGSVFI